MGLFARTLFSRTLAWLAPVSRQARGSLRQEAIVSQKVFCDPVAVFAWFQACNHAVWKGPRSPKQIATIAVLRSYLSPSVFTVRSGPVWRQDLAILSPKGPRDNTCQLRTLLPWPILCGFQGKILHAKVLSKPSFCRTLLGSNFGGRLLEQIGCLEKGWNAQGVTLQYLAAATTLETCLEHPFTQPKEDKLLHNSRNNAIVLWPLRTIASHELLHELLRLRTTIAATPLAESTPSPNTQTNFLSALC